MQSSNQMPAFTRPNIVMPKRKKKKKKKKTKKTKKKKMPRTAANIEKKTTSDLINSAYDSFVNTAHPGGEQLPIIESHAHKTTDELISQAFQNFEADSEDDSEV
jgi:hypothetical protein